MITNEMHGELDTCKILKNGKPAYKDKTSPEYYNWHLTW